MLRRAVSIKKGGEEAWLELIQETNERELILRTLSRGFYVKKRNKGKQEDRENVGSREFLFHKMKEVTPCLFHYGNNSLERKKMLPLEIMEGRIIESMYLNRSETMGTNA